MKRRFSIYRTRRRLAQTLATNERLSSRKVLGYSLAIFLVSFTVKSLHAVDMAPVMYTIDHPFGGLTDQYDARARLILQGKGILGPYDVDPRQTVWISQAPGYSVYLSVIYALVGSNFFTVQLVQNLLNSVTPILLFLIVGMLLSWRVGIVAGFLTGLSHHLSHISNYILPDSVSALPILLAFLILAVIRQYPHHLRGGYLYAGYLLAGLLLGCAAWLRSQTMLLGLFLAAVFLVILARRFAPRGALATLALVSLLMLVPITIKNYVVYKEFIPVNIGAGIVLWEGIADASGSRFGAVATDDEVAKQDAELYGNPAYAASWSTPDGIERDRNRVDRSLKVIKEHPLWYAGVMAKRALGMLKYSADAPLVYRARRTVSVDSDGTTGPDNSIARGVGIAAGERLAFLRPIVRLLQRLSKEAMQVFILIGGVSLGLMSRRRLAYFLALPIYYFFFQSLFHTEFRYTLPMQYFVFALAAITWTLLVSGFLNILRRQIGNRLWLRTGTAVTFE